MALRGVLKHGEGSPLGTPEQARANAAASDLPPLPPETMVAVREVYDELIRPQVHHRW